VGQFFLVANSDASAPDAVTTEAANGDGFYEAVVRSIAERRPALR
jgi:hypothetical protein